MKAMRKVIIETPSVQGMEREFVETFEFRKRWKALRLDDEDLRVLQDTLCANPKVGDLIQGAGGVRKVRLELQGRGKSGGARIVYVDFAAEERLYLISVFAKNEQGTLTAKQKSEIKDFVKSL
jgi:hypothetical protein